MKQPIQVLLVEDNPGDADLTRETLEEGKVLLNLDVAIDGIDALDFLCRRPPYEQAPTPDLILLDLNLPRMNGHEVLAALKESPRWRTIPVVVLTSSEAENDIFESYGLGANCYVTKPVGLQEFQRIVQSVKDFWFTIVRLP